MYVNKGTTIDYVATADLNGGDMVSVGDLVGVSAAKVATGENVVVEIAGKFKLPKDPTVAIAIGKKCYLKAGTQLVTGTASGNSFLGYAATGQLSADTEIEVVLKQL